MTSFPLFPATLLPHPRFPDTTVVAEFALPTGSFKDRGAAAVVADAVARHARTVALDSSGNAGLAVAMAASRAGLSTVIRGASISPPKEILLRAAGARLETFATREAAVRACAEDHVSYDASHVRNPLFRKGVSTLAAAWRRHSPPPETIFLPVGNGSLLLGLFDGFTRLIQSGDAARMPRFIAVQSERCAPIARPEAPGDGRTIADGCAILSPLARAEILAVLERTAGAAVAVSEGEIEAAWRDAWADGFPIEPTAALSFAGRARSKDVGESAVVATGSGLKIPPPPKAA
jgi:threonine synthase